MITLEEKFAPKRNRGVAEKYLDKAEADLGTTIPKSLRSLYLRFNGVDPKHHSIVVPTHLMSLKEVVRVHKFLMSSGPQFEAAFREHGLVCFWDSGNSDLAGVFTRGPLEGCVFLLDHDGYFLGDCSPVFTSLDKFYAELSVLTDRNAKVEEYEEQHGDFDLLEREMAAYPHYCHFDPDGILEPWCMKMELPAAETGFDSALEYFRIKLASLATDDSRYIFVALTLARLLPASDPSELFPLMELDDLHVPGRIAEIIGVHRPASAIPSLVELTLAGNHNCRGNGARVLAKYIFADPATETSIREEFRKQNGEFSEVQSSLDHLRKYPSLFYQW